MASVIETNDILAEYKYAITEFFIIIEGVSEPFPTERITDFKIEHYFEEAMFPIFKLNLTMEASRYYRMLEYKDDVKFKIRIQKYYYKDEDGYRYKENDDKSKTMLTDVINDTFIWYPEDANKDLQLSLKMAEKQKKNNDDTPLFDFGDNNQLDKLLNDVEIFLFKETVSTLRSKVNLVFKNTNMQTIVATLLDMAGVNHVLMSPFDNKTNYSTVVLPPLNIDKQIMYLSNNYGFHKNGTIVYFGLFKAYILNYKGGCTAYEKNEWTETKLYILKKENTASFMSGAVIKTDQKAYHYNISPDLVDHKNTTVLTNVLDGTDVVVVNTFNGSDAVKTKSESIVIGKPNSKIIFNESGNSYMPTTIAAQQKSNSNIISISLENAVIESFNPNKHISLIFEDTRYNDLYKGNYKIATALHHFTNEGASYTCTTTLVLKKI